MKTNLKNFTTVITLMCALNVSYAQKNDRRDRDDRNSRDENYDNNGRNDRDDRRDWNDYDRDDNDRIGDYERGRNNFRRNPYDYRNLPRDWDRNRTSRFDWYRFDWDNRYDPRYSNRNYFDLYYPWDPSNPYDIRNRRDYYGSNQYWNGGRPNRIVIVPPIVRFGHPAWASRNRGNHYGHGNGRGRGRR